MQDTLNAKLQAQQAYENAKNACDSNLQQAGKCVSSIGGSYRPSLSEEAAKSAEYHTEAANKATAAYMFLSQHPEFDEFVRLVRSGALQF